MSGTGAGTGPPLSPPQETSGGVSEASGLLSRLIVDVVVVVEFGVPSLPAQAEEEVEEEEEAMVVVLDKSPISVWTSSFEENCLIFGLLGPRTRPSFAYSHTRPLFVHRLHEGCSPLHFALRVLHFSQAWAVRNRGCSGVR